MPPTPSALEGLVIPYLERQPWFIVDMARYDRGPVASFSLADLEILRDGRPGMASVVVTVGDRPFHVLVGWRDLTQGPAALGDQQGAVLGVCDDGAGDVLCYAALADEELAAELLAIASGGIRARDARPPRAVARQPRLARLRRAPLPEVLPCPRAGSPARDRAPAEAGAGRLHAHVRPRRPLGAQRLGPRPRAPVHPRRGGRAASSPSRRFATCSAAPSTRRSCATTRSAGPGATSPRRCAAWGRSPPGSIWPSPRPSACVGSKTAEALAGAAIRVHGDYHLRRVFRTDDGWVVGGFGDDPLIGRPDGRQGPAQGPLRLAA